MIRSAFVAVALLGATPLAAQGAPAIPYAGSAEIAALVAKAKATIKPDQPVLVQPLLTFGPYTALLEYRQGAAGGAIHKAEDEVFHVVEGAGTLMLGGTIVDGKDDPKNVMGSATTGGSARRVAAGDVFVIPAGTPHWFNTVEGSLVMVAMKVPAGAAK